MRKLMVFSLLCLGAAFGRFGAASAQEVSDFLAVGEAAPDIELAGATRHGTLAEPVSLSQLRGATVVLAFFFKVRTGG